MSLPTVSFVVPCYKLASLLPECVHSILSQSYGDFEILILDDCSPDNTAEVARSFTDPRVRYIRHEKNLGHLRNYNYGITASRGKYVWLISADDYLRDANALQKYVDIMERHPNVGYAFSPGYGVRDGQETRVLGCYSNRFDRDRILPGRTLLKRLLGSNFVLTPSGLVRRECYEKLSLFELDMPWCGDWYLWCLFALHYDVAYVADKLVCYREHHDLSMTTKLTTEKLDICAAEEISVPWRIRERALQAGLDDVARDCLMPIARTYARTIASERYRPASTYMNFDAFEASVSRHGLSDGDRTQLRTYLWLYMGNEFYWQQDAARAKEYYEKAYRSDVTLIRARLKTWLLAAGRPGTAVRRTILAFR